MGRRGEDENEENAIKCSRKQITFSLWWDVIWQGSILHERSMKLVSWCTACMLTHSPSSDTCPLVFCGICPKTFLSSHRRPTIHSLFDLIFPRLVSQLLLASRILARPLPHPFFWHNSPLKRFPFTYSWNYVHNKVFFCNELRHQSYQKALTPLVFLPVAYRALTPSLCITAVEVLVLQSCLQGRPFQTGISAHNCPPDSCTCTDQRSDYYPWRAQTFPLHSLVMHSGAQVLSNYKWQHLSILAA